MLLTYENYKTQSKLVDAVYEHVMSLKVKTNWSDDEYRRLNTKKVYSCDKKCDKCQRLKKLHNSGLCFVEK